jgi:hypothetical protein
LFGSAKKAQPPTRGKFKCKAEAAKGVLEAQENSSLAK